MIGVLKPMELDLDITSGKLIYVPMPNFGYKMIPEYCCVKIDDYQIMTIYNRIEIDGLLLLNGDLAFIG